MVEYVYKEGYADWRKLKVLEESNNYFIVEEIEDNFYKYGPFAIEKNRVSKKPIYDETQLKSLLEKDYLFKYENAKFLSMAQLKKEALSLGLVTEDQIKDE